jgi:hypothetical protein
MKMRMKPIPQEISREKIHDRFPKDKPWILFLGTSHTHGSCEENGLQVLEDHERYSGRLKAKFPDYEIVNLAIPGNNNTVMLSQLCEINEYGIDISNLKLVIADVRVGDPAGIFCADTYRDFNTEKKRDNSLLAKGSDINHHQIRDEWLSHYATGDKLKNPNYLSSLLKTHFNDEIVPESAIKRLGEYISIREEFYHTSVHTFIDDIDKIRAMQNITRLMGVKFRWFHLDSPHFIGDTPNKFVVMDYYKKWSNLWQDRCDFEIDGFTDDKMKGVKILMQKAFGYHLVEDTFLCDCRHINSKGNEIIADLLYKEIKSCLNN